MKAYELIPHLQALNTLAASANLNDKKNEKKDGTLKSKEEQESFRLILAREMR